MTPDELRALADALEPMSSAPRFEGMNVLAFCKWLRAQADAQPVATLTLLDDIGAQIDFHQSFTLLPGQTFSLYAHPAPAVPAGWKLVPVEPTGLMVDAGREAMQHAPDLGGIVSANTAEVMDSYTAMLAAAPAAPQAEQPIDLDAVAMQQMRQAAAESTWMPSEYTSNDWIADVCRWLRDGPPAAAPQAEPKEENNVWKQIIPDDAPQAEPKREPLDDDEISKLAWQQNVWADGLIEFSFLAFARAVERAHGISGGGHD